MSFSKTKTFLVGGLLLAMTLIIADTAPAWDGRLWKPYQPEQFGGSRRPKDGVYGSVEAIWWRIDPPGNTDSVLRELKEVGLATTMDASAIPAEFALGGRFALGNRRGHHGWRFTGYSISGLGGAVTHGDPIDVSRQGRNTIVYRWPSGLNDGKYYRIDDDWMDIRAKRELVYRSRTNITDLDLAWTYRAHPFSWGELEFFVGAKYRDVNDGLFFSDKATSYLYESFVWDLGRKYNGDSRLNWSGYELARIPSGDTVRNLESSSGDLTPSISENTHYVDREARNRMVGPNLGFELTRRNRRWTFGAVPSLFLGVNNQSFTFFEHYFDRALSQADVALLQGQTGGADWSNLSLDSLVALRNTFAGTNTDAEGETPRVTTRYNRHRAVFTPGVGLQLSAKWQWTDAIGIKVSFDSAIMDNVARGSDLVATPRFIDGPINDDTGEASKVRDGYDFGLRSRGAVVTLYGISIGLEMRR